MQVDANIDFESGLSLLHLAVVQGNFNAVKALLSLGADPDKVDLNGRTALHLGLKYGRCNE